MVRVFLPEASGVKVLDDAGHVSELPRIHAAARRLTSTGSLEKLRSPMTGLAGLLLTSSTGAKFQLMPSDFSPCTRTTPRMTRDRPKMN